MWFARLPGCAEIRERRCMHIAWTPDFNSACGLLVWSNRVFVSLTFADCTPRSQLARMIALTIYQVQQVLSAHHARHPDVMRFTPYLHLEKRHPDCVKAVARHSGIALIPINAERTRSDRLRREDDVLHALETSLARIAFAMSVATDCGAPLGAPAWKRHGAVDIHNRVDSANNCRRFRAVWEGAQTSPSYPGSGGTRTRG